MSRKRARFSIVKAVHIGEVRPDVQNPCHRKGSGVILSMRRPPGSGGSLLVKEGKNADRCCPEFAGFKLFCGVFVRTKFRAAVAAVRSEVE